MNDWNLFVRMGSRYDRSICAFSTKIATTQRQFWLKNHQKYPAFLAKRKLEQILTNLLKIKQIYNIKTRKRPPQKTF